MKRPPFRIHPVAGLVGIVGAVFVVAWPQTVRADVAPSCDDGPYSLASFITCAAADVGKPCQGGGSCYAMNCEGGTTGFTNMTVYKCYTCPTIVAYDGGCYPPGNACGDGGECSDIPGWCLPKNHYSCAIDAPAQPTGPPAGEDAGVGGGGSGGASSVGGAGGASSVAGAGGSSSVAGAGGRAGVAGAGGGAGAFSTSGAAGAASSGTGGGAGSSASSGGCGCALIKGTPTSVEISGGLLGIGLVFLTISRRRRPR
jgi:hypothetical protein